MEKEIKINVVDIWSILYTTYLKYHLRQIGTIEGKAAYKSDMRDHLYMLTDSRVIHNGVIRYGNQRNIP